MKQSQCVEIARAAAVACIERHDYLPRNIAAAEAWQPHLWVVDAMLCAAADAERERDSYKAGNTALLELLMNLLHEADITSNAWRVFDLLKQAGLIDSDDKLDWAALEARKPKQQTWAEAVNECVTDPDERARLLAIGG